MEMTRVLEKDHASRSFIQRVAVMVQDFQPHYSQQAMFDTIMRLLEIQEPVSRRNVDKFTSTGKTIITDVYAGRIKTMAEYEREIPASAAQTYVVHGHVALDMLKQAGDPCYKLPHQWSLYSSNPGDPYAQERAVCDRCGRDQPTGFVMSEDVNDSIDD